MSYILKALKRAQVDPSEQAIARVATRSSTAKARRSLWPWLLGGGLAVMALAVGAVFVATHQRGLTGVALAPVEHAAAPTEAPAPPAPAEPSRPETAAPASADSVSTVPAENKVSPTSVAPVHAQQGHHSPGAAETKNGEVAPSRRPDAALALVQPPAPVRPAPPAPARPSAPDPAIAPQPPAAPDPPADPPARRRRAPRREPTSAPEPATTLPTRSAPELNLKIEVVVWAPDPRQRMIYVNGLKYVEGQKLDEGAILEQIVEDGVVLIHNGQRIRVKAGPR